MLFQMILLIILSEFQEDFSLKQIKCPVKFTQLTGYETFHGYRIHVRGQDTVLIDSDHFVKLPFIHQRELIYHELGHCELNLTHRHDIDIMRQKVYSTNKDGKNWKALVNKMKKRYRRSR